jgi:hypothetical protein
MLVEDLLEREVGPTRGWQTKWKKEKKVHLDLVEELQKIQKFEDPDWSRSVTCQFGTSQVVYPAKRAKRRSAIGNDKGSRFAKWSQKVSWIDQLICQASRS